MAAVVAVLNDNPRFIHHPGRRFVDQARDWYGTAMALGYRRQTDHGDRSASLRVLLEELRVRPTAYRLETLKPALPNATDESIRKYVMANVIKDGSDHLDEEIVRSDLHMLLAVGKVVKDFVDAQVAHTFFDVETDDDADRAKALNPTFDQIHRAAEACEPIAERWRTALTGDQTRKPFAVPTEFDWMNVFDFPWRTRRPNDGPNVRRYIVTVDESNLSPVDYEAWLEAYGGEEAYQTRRVLEIARAMQALGPDESLVAEQLLPAFVNVRRVL
jgi:hypothetical protein